LAKTTDLQVNQQQSVKHRVTDLVDCLRVSTTLTELSGCGQHVYHHSGHHDDLTVVTLCHCVVCQILTAAQCRCYANERDVLTMPLMRHAGVVEFVGCREDWLASGGGTQLMIVMSYERLGCLVEYLKNNTVDWSMACRMMHSLAAGLAHLHTELTNGGKIVLFITMK